MAIQSQEAKYFKRILFGTKAKVLTLGDVIAKNECTSNINLTFGMIGTLYSPNITALKWFVETVLPTIKKQVPNCKFVLAGKVCEAIPDSDLYEKIGVVEDVSEFYKMVRFVVSPIQNGTGLKIKCIEALSYGKPVISTSIGAVGLEKAKNAMIICNDSKQFAESVVNLLDDEDKLNCMTKAAYSFVDEYQEDNRKTIMSIEMIKKQNVKK